MTTGVRRRPRRLAVVATLVAAVACAIVAVLLLISRDDDFTYDDPFEALPVRPEPGSGVEVERAPDPAKEPVRFLRFVTDDVQGFWQAAFAASGMAYRPAGVVVFDRVVQSGCGRATEGAGPFYCSADQDVYLDEDFFRELAQEFRAPGDFAAAYVIAHEVGHHVQNLTGIMAQVQAASVEGLAPPNLLSIRQELQADCYAGVWGRSTYRRGMVEQGDLEEALRAAAAVGDDRIQAETMGRVVPETWTHGSSDQRMSWWLSGFQSGDPDACDTYSEAL